MGFYKLKSHDPNDGKVAGDGIIEVSKSVFQPASEWSNFDANPKQWLYDHNYRYHNDDGSLYTVDDWCKPAGFTPDELQIVPVYDTDNRMHVRVPYQEYVEDPGIKFPIKESYESFAHLLASYFVRKCR